MKSFPELIGSGNPEAHDYAAALGESMKLSREKLAADFIEGKFSKSMIERVAIAMREDGHPGWWSTASEDEKEIWRRMARVGIEAMREPTGAMWSAGDRLVLPSAGDWATDTTAVWQAMIDAALEKTS